jgi:hypothetical protein
MIQATELRIGNLFQWISTNGIAEVLDIETTTKKRVNINGVQISDLKPIPLTEDWFFKFGFLNCKKNGSNYFADRIDDPNDATMRFAHPDSDWIYSIGDDNHGVIFNKISYVHQLQNLYFALTGKELTLKQ